MAAISEGTHRALARNRVAADRHDHARSVTARHQEAATARLLRPSPPRPLEHRRASLQVRGISAGQARIFIASGGRGIRTHETLVERSTVFRPIAVPPLNCEFVTEHHREGTTRAQRRHDTNSRLRPTQVGERRTRTRVSTVGDTGRGSPAKIPERAASSSASADQYGQASRTPAFRSRAGARGLDRLSLRS